MYIKEGKVSKSIVERWQLDVETSILVTPVTEIEDFSTKTEI